MHCLLFCSVQAVYITWLNGSSSPVLTAIFFMGKPTIRTPTEWKPLTRMR